MREVKVRTLWKEGKAAVNGWLSIPNAYTAELMSKMGWDALTIDMQHGLVEYADALNMLTAMSASDVTPVVRVPWLEAGIIQKMLDAGAMGIICPMVNTREDAENLVAWSKYAPLGVRSVGPIRAGMYAGGNYVAEANAETIVFAMIETKKALDNLDDILSVEGLDGCYIGPSDLSLSLGLPPAQNNRDNATYEAQLRVLETAKKNGVHPGLHNASAEYAHEMIELGFEFVTAGSDSGSIAGAARAAIATARGEG